ncbi:hypothetical protein EBU99_10030, partial [bacterium]|nr:hypothetical protein [bacterium]
QFDTEPDQDDIGSDLANDLSDYMGDDDDVADYKLSAERDPDHETTRTTPVAVSRSFHEFLEEQLLLLDLDDRQMQLAQYIVGSIDADGYLRRTLDAMVDDIAFSLNLTTSETELQLLLKRIQHLEPAGVGARDLKECLLLQIQRIKEHPVINKIAVVVIENYFDEFVKKHYEKLQKQLEVQDDTFKMVMDTILKLNPKPGSAYQSSSSAEYFLLPDFYLNNTDGELEVTLNGMNVPDLRISSNFKEMLKEYSLNSVKDKKQKEAVMFIKQKIDSALAQLGERVGFAALMKKSKTLGSRVEFGVEHKGFEARLSVFAGVSVSSDSQTEANIISGSQWKDVSFEDMAEVRRNHFTITQVTDLTCSRSNFSANEMGLARLSNVSIAESRFENNRLSRSQCIDVSMAESDFTHNRLLRSELRGVVLNASRIANLVMSGSKWSECDFDQSDLQGLKFEGCTFTECRFVNCEIVAADSQVLSGLKVEGRTFEGLRSWEELRAALEPLPVGDQTPRRQAPSHVHRQNSRRSRTSRR